MKYQRVRKIISFISSLSLVFQTFLPLTFALPVYAEDASPAAIVEVSPTPSVTPEITPESTPTPEISPSAEPTVEPTIEITPTVSPIPEVTVIPEVSITPEPTLEITPVEQQNNQEPQNNSPPAEENNSSTPTPTPTPSANLSENLNVLTNLELGVTEIKPTLSTDKSDYFPTDTVYVTGTGFQSNVTYVFHIFSSDSPAFSTRPEITVDENGNVSFSFRLDGNYRPNYTIEAIDQTNSLVTSYSFTDDRTINSILLNNNPTVTVGQSEVISVSIQATTSWWFGGDNDWKSTDWRIGDSGSWICEDHGNHTSDGTYTEVFNVTSPSTDGIYDISFRAYSDNSCSNGQSSTKTLSDSIVVSTLITPPVLPNNPSDDYALTSVFGVWTSVSGGSNVTGINTEEVRWGTTQGQKSGLRFDGSGVQTFNTGATFYLGALTHFNYPIQNPSSGAKLRITLQFSKPTVSPNPSFSYDFVIDETTNSSPCNSGWQISNIACDDRVRFPSSYGSTSFQIDDKLYTLQISGFVNSYPGGNPVSQFVTQEERNNTAYLVGSLSSVLVSAPQISLVEKAVNGNDADFTPGDNLYVGDSASFTYSVQNTGNVSMTNISVVDDKGVVITCPNTTLVSGESMVCTGTSTVTVGQYTNTAHVHGTYNGNVYESNTESANYFGIVRNVCGDGNKSASEACDSGASNGTVCTPTYGGSCTYCSTSCEIQTVTGPMCGDYRIDSGETCDDGNIASGDGCSSSCQLEKGTLVVKKHVINDNGGTKVASDFTLNTSGTNISQTSVIGNESGVSLTLNAGSYSVDETVVPTGYAKSIGANCSGTIAAGETKTCTITNNDIQPKITVTKIVVGDSSPVSNFILKVGNTTVTSGVQNGFSAGTHTVSEYDPAGAGYPNYTKLIGGDCASNGSITLSPGDVKSCTITNTRKTATLRVLKNVDLNGDGDYADAGETGATDWQWKTRWTGDLPEYAHSGNTGDSAITVVNGNHFIAETAKPNFHQVSISCTGDLYEMDSASGHTVGIGENTNVVCTFTNARDTGNLIVKKVVINDNGGTKAASDFKYSINGGAEVTFEADGQNDNNVITGPYSVTEPGVAGYVTTYDNCENVTVSKDLSSTCTITNNDIAPTLKLSKIVVNDNGGTKAASDWILSATGTVLGFSDAGNSTSFHNVEAGVTYGLSESGPSGYSNSWWTCTGGEASGNTIKLGLGENVTCSITNSYIPFCGDGIVNQNSESCDGPEGVPDHYICNSNCGLEYVPYCGDGIQNQASESCDGTSGITLGSNFCSTSCKLVPIYSGNNVCSEGKVRGEKVASKSISSTSATGEVLGLTSGKEYLFEASQTFNPTSAPGYLSDAAFTWVNDVLSSAYGINGTGNDLGAHALLGNLGLGVGIIKWNNSVDHTYTFAYTPTNSSQQFVIGDRYDDWFNTPYQNQSGVGDNTGSLNLDVYECILNQGSVSGQKYSDLNGNGYKDSDEIGLSGWTIKLLNETGNGEIASATTITDGSYAFSNIPSGNYQVCEINQSGWKNTDPGAGVATQACKSITVTAANNTVTSFGNQQLGVINVTKFNDADGNGSRNGNEAVLGNWTINLSNGSSAVTGENGKVSFPDLTPNADYTVSETMQDGWYQTGISCDLDSSEGTTQITAPGEAYGHHGYCSGWNGCTDAATCAQWACEVKGYDHVVSYGDERPCTQFENCNLFNSRGNVQYNWGNGCDVSGVTDIVCSGTKSSTSSQVRVNPGEVVNCSIGNRQYGSISGYKWDDQNGNHEMDCEESGDRICEPKLESWKIFIDKNGDGLFNEGETTVNTNTSGDYQFSNLVPGNYSVCEESQSGWTRFYPENSNCHSVTVVGGSNSGNINFGNHRVDAKLKISRSNNATSPLSSGSSVEHTITIKVLDNDIRNLKLTDLLPKGFSFSGSYSVSSTQRGDIALDNDPEYHSPGVWELGDYEVDDVITIKYLADVSSDVLPGTYTDLAYASANDAYEQGFTYLAEGENSEYVDENYVGTDVEVVKSQTDNGSYEVEKEEVKTGTVLGASTSLPATGASPIWIMLALVSLVYGIRLIKSSNKK